MMDSSLDLEADLPTSTDEILELRDFIQRMLLEQHQISRFWKAARWFTRPWRLQGFARTPTLLGAIGTDVRLPEVVEPNSYELEPFSQPEHRVRDHPAAEPTIPHPVATEEMPAVPSGEEPTPSAGSTISQQPVRRRIMWRRLTWQEHATLARNLITIALHSTAVALSAVAVWHAVSSTLLAQWTSEKEYLEYCEAHAWSPTGCEKAENSTLGPPPGYTPNHGRRDDNSTLSDPQIFFEKIISTVEVLCMSVMLWHGFFPRTPFPWFVLCLSLPATAFVLMQPTRLTMTFVAGGMPLKISEVHEIPSASEFFTFLMECLVASLFTSIIGLLILVFMRGRQRFNWPDFPLC
ncbi:hypothetical protein QBC35DRAFT_208915 [Podospora australis]|uniref:Uncharacterized protein n=1 Tax=Podospora australis TaxID=1536484 RepID=A0AAN6WVC4_9PEZI|nr:hypothetical protein QBC35DRAFT_208915 [Podospora australis]